MPNTIAPFGHPLYVMLKPVGAACNLRCEYCYYLEKQNLYDKAERHVMTEEMLERFTREYIEAAHPTKSVAEPNQNTNDIYRIVI